MKVKQVIRSVESNNRLPGLETENNGRNTRGLFTKGNTFAKGIGRPIGSKDKINILRDMLLDELTLVYNGNTANVIQAIRRVMQDKPEHILTLAAKLIPNTLEIENIPEYAPVILEGAVIEKAPSDELEAIEGEIKLMED